MSETPKPSLITDEVTHLVALGAAIACNAERAFEAHHSRLADLGVSKEDMIKAVNVALRVKGDPHQGMIEMAEGLLVGQKGGCCGGGNCSEEGCGDEEGGCGEGGCGCH